MFTKVMKFAAVAALLTAMLFQPSAGYKLTLEVVICLSGLTVLWEAARAGRYIWLAGFAGIAILFNPVAPIALSRRTFLWLDVVTVVMFLISLAVLHVRPTLSVPSITNRTPGSESL